MPEEQFGARHRLMVALTSHVSWKFYEGQIAFLARNGFDVEAVSGPGPMLAAVENEGARTWVVPMEREIAPFKDIVSFCRLWLLFRRRRPDILIAGTPKAGLLATAAARFAGVRNVVYLVLGLRLETASGWKRRILWLTEWLACHFAHHVRAIAPSVRDRLVSFGLVASAQVTVIAPGTVNGIDVQRWRRTSAAELVRHQTRANLGIPRHAAVIGFVGRLTRDKGIPELYEAFSRLRDSSPDMRLLLVGDFEDGDPVAPQLRARIEADPSVVRTGFIDKVERFYWAMDVLALPTWREGFPGVPLEAQAASLPLVTTDATGASDAILDGITGIRIPVGDVDSLTAALAKLIEDESLRKQMGEAGKMWVQENFRREFVWKNLLSDYRLILQGSLSGRQAWVSWLKRPVDCTVAVLVLVLGSPLLFLSVIAIRLTLGAPVLFRQVRPGLNGRPFTLLKFRTMRDARNPEGVFLDDAERLTPLGRILRAASIDELPQLWNVLRGEMSLVGPRPLLVQYLDRYTPEQARRHEVKPGITGWAQVNGRNALSWEEKFALDVWYVDHWSLSLDCEILWLTLLRVLKREGISSQGHATMPEFLGSPSPAKADHD
jgi:lipopolysaccharide/colanic/teichoic acid biosynthesis glycosyltransferase